MHARPLIAALFGLSTVVALPAPSPVAASGTCTVVSSNVVAVLLDGGASRLTSTGASIRLDGADCGTGDIVSITAAAGTSDRIVIDATTPWRNSVDVMEVVINGLEANDSLRVITTREYDFVEMCTTADGSLRISSANEEAALLDLSAAASVSTPVRIDLGAGNDTFIHRTCARGPASTARVAVYGGRGADNLVGGPGRQVLFGQAGRDDLQGGKGDDRLVGGPQADTLDGGPGTDSCGCDAADTVVRIP